MAIVPNGNRRLMKFQQSTNPELQKRDAVEQEEIPVPGQPPAAQGGYNPFGNLKNTLQNQPQQTPQVPNQQDLNNAADPEKDVIGKIGPDAQGNSEQEGDGDSSQIGTDFRAAYHQIMESLGVPPRIFKHPQHGDKFFHIDEEVIGNGEAKGFFILPSKTAEKGISKEEAWGMARKLGSQFGVTKMNFSYAPGDNYKFTFQVLVQDKSQMSGSSLDALINGGKGSGQGGLARAAESRNSLIKESHNHIINSLLKQGIGGSHAS